MANEFTLITGGAGFIASHFIEEFPSENYIIIDNDPKKLNKTDSKHILADIRDTETMQEIFQKYPIHTVLHLAAAHKDFGIEPDEYFSTNVTGTEILCHLAAKFGVRRFIFYSSVAVYGDSEEPTNDTSQPNPNHDYGRSKLDGEKVTNLWFENDKSRTLIIIRPALVYGERNIANMYRLIDQIARGRYFNLGKAENIKSIAYVKNLVHATGFLMKKIGEGKHVFNYSDQPHLKVSDITATIAKELGVRQPFGIPKPLLLLAAKPFDLLIKISGKDFPISSNRVKKLGTQTYHRSEKLFDTGFIPKFSQKEGLGRMVHWYKEVNME